VSSPCHTWKAVPVRHGYTNRTERVPLGVRKTYEGPDSLARADAEFAALSRLDGVMPVPAVLDRQADGSIVMEFRAGEHGQDLIDAGRADRVMASSGALLRRLHGLSPSLLAPGDHAPGDVICHGDFGPNNLLFDPNTYTVTALLDWEFSGTGAAIGDLAWCEWIVRMHHPASVASLTAFFDAYGEPPPWEDRQSFMVERCLHLESFARRWDPDGEGVRVWQERARTTAAWTP
jgi:aminoglycoside phosphotransferase (APT) family kinase protein